MRALGVASVPASLELVFVVDRDVSDNYGELLLMYVDSRYPIRHWLPPGGRGECAGVTLTRVAGYRRPRRERGNAPFIRSIAHTPDQTFYRLQFLQ